MGAFTVAEIASELEVSRSYLYKIIKDEKIILDKTDRGRYVWDKQTINQLKQLLDISSNTEEDSIKKLINKAKLCKTKTAFTLFTYQYKRVIILQI